MIERVRWLRNFAWRHPITTEEASALLEQAESDLVDLWGLKRLEAAVESA